jgi:hypothetical protein
MTIGLSHHLTGAAILFTTGVLVSCETLEH